MGLGADHALVVSDLRPDDLVLENIAKYILNFHGSKRFGSDQSLIYNDSITPPVNAWVIE